MSFAAACSSGDGGGAGGGSSAAQSAGNGNNAGGGKADSGPQYKGDAIPGLADRPAWGVAVDSVGACVPRADAVSNVALAEPEPECAFGDAVVLVRSPEDDRDETVFTATIRDGATGTVRATVEVKLPVTSTPDHASEFIKIGRWKDGSPALVVRTYAKTEADGLKAEAERTTLTMYAPSGKVLGTSEFDGNVHQDPEVWDGYLVAEKSNFSDDYTLLPIGGGPEVKPSDALRSPPVLEPNRRPPLKYTLLTRDVGRGLDPAEGITVRDTFTNQELWSTVSVPVPEPIRALVGPDKAPHSRVVAFRDKVVLVAWTAPSNGPTTFTAHDPATGRLIAQGPTTAAGVTVADQNKTGVAVSPDGGVAVVALTKGAVAWDTASGAKLWEQAADERQLRPKSISPQGVLYAVLDGGSGTAALDVRTHRLLAEGLDEVPSYGDKFGVVRAGRDYFVFSAAPPR